MSRISSNSGKTLVAALCCAGTLFASCQDGAGGPLAPEAGGAGGSGGSVGGSGSITDSGGSSGAANLAGESGGGAAGASSCPDDPKCSREGDSCVAPYVIRESGFLVHGDAFTDDFRDDLVLEHASCPLTEASASDAVFQVELEAGDELWVTQTGWLPAAIAIQQACGEGGACRAVGEERGVPVRYLASSRETVYVVVQAIQEKPRSEDEAYAIHIDIDPACGNGIFEGPEQCDDGNTTEGDGCAPDCSIEFLYQCDLSSPSECEVYPSLGKLGADASLEPPFTHEEPLETDQELRYTITFTERVVAVIEAAARGAGDIDISVRSSWDDRVWSSAESGDELSEALGFEPGTYLVRFFAASPLPEGFEFRVTTESPPECGNEQHEPPFEECDSGDGLGCSEDCRVDFGFECQGDAPSICSSIQTLGEFAPGDPIPVVSYPISMSEGSSHFHMIRFSADVLLSATLIGIEPESDAGNHVSWVRFTNESGAMPIDQHVTPSPFTGLVEIVNQPLAADLYRIEVFTDTGLPEGYQLTLSTETP